MSYRSQLPAPQSPLLVIVLGLHPLPVGVDLALQDPAPPLLLPPPLPLPLFYRIHYQTPLPRHHHHRLLHRRLDVISVLLRLWMAGLAGKPFLLILGCSNLHSLLECSKEKNME